MDEKMSGSAGPAIKITEAMKTAGAMEVEKYPLGDYDAFFVAEQVFLAMMAHLEPPLDTKS